MHAKTKKQTNKKYIHRVAQNIFKMSLYFVKEGILKFLGHDSKIITGTFKSLNTFSPGGIDVIHNPGVEHSFC